MYNTKCRLGQGPLGAGLKKIGGKKKDNAYIRVNCRNRYIFKCPKNILSDSCNFSMMRSQSVSRPNLRLASSCSAAQANMYLASAKWTVLFVGFSERLQTGVPDQKLMPFGETCHEKKNLLSNNNTLMS